MMKTYEEEIKDIKGKPSKMGLTISDMPLWLFKKFITDIKYEYNDQYWVKLMDLMRKAEAYDSMMSGYDIPQEQPQQVIPEEKEEKDDEGVMTFAGKVN